jgi:drug/metabolite transporter (DMT)-like permease
VTQTLPRARLALIPPVLALAWGLNWPAVKIALTAIPPFTLRAAGLGTGAVLLALLALAQGRRLLPQPGAWRGVWMGGVLTVALFNICTALAQLNTSTSRAAVLTFTMPMMSALLAWALMGERLRRRQTAALVLGMAGIALLAWPVLHALANASITPREVKGLAFPLIAALGWALGTVLAKRWPVAGDRLVIALWQLAIAACCAGTGAWLVGEAPPAWPLPVRVVAAFVFHVALGTSIAYWLWEVLSQQVSAAVSSMTTLFVPVVGVLGAMALVGDRPSALDWAGFALVLGGAAAAMLQLHRRA